jgi:hypothetical protein|uniref:Uncharacterized protein n=1 Tax=viral metagenome TaxID=1070528 RepID=A0A6C0JGT7_9ZZZZ
MTGALFHVDPSESDVNVVGSLNVTGDTRITGDTSVTGPIDVVGDLNVGGNIYGNGVLLNTTQYIDTTDRSTTSGSEQTGFTTGWTSMKANSKVKLDVHIPWRNDGHGWGGSYHTIYMMVNKQVGTVSANHWVALATSGYYMTYYQDILSYTNNFFIPLVVNEDFQIRFYHSYKVYNNGTLYINQAHHLYFKNDSDNAQFGIPHPHAGYLKFIVREIGG